MDPAVYIDNNATTRVAPEVVERMLPFFHEQWGNPSSMYGFGSSMKREVERAREQVAELIGAEHPNEIVFTSCGSESNNMALRGVVDALGGTARLISTQVEHSSVLETCAYLEERGCPLSLLGVDGQGHLEMEPLHKAAISDERTLASIMWGNNETGIIFPMAEISAMLKEQGAVVHTDAVQMVGKCALSVRDLPIDLLSLSGHKLYAPKGIGALYIRRGTRIAPLILGGHQERGRRAGTENVPYIVGLGAACELARQQMEADAEHERRLRDRLEEGILASCKGARINGDPATRLPNTTNISFEHLEGEAILLMLDDVGIYASTGAACASGSLDPSHVLKAMEIPRSQLQGSIRFSLSRYTTDAEIDYLLEQMPRIIRRLREQSPLVND